MSSAMSPAMPLNRTPPPPNLLLLLPSAQAAAAAAAALRRAHHWRVRGWEGPRDPSRRAPLSQCYPGSHWVTLARLVLLLGSVLLLL